MPAVGTTFVTAYDTTATAVSVLSPGVKGANVIWNFASLHTSYRDTSVFVAPSSTPYAASFAGANLADSVFGTPGYNYLNSSSSILSIVGSEQNAQGYMVAVVFNTPITELNLPAHYGDIDGGSVVAKVPPVAVTYPGFDSAKGVIYVTYADTIDAYGTIATPLYSSYNTLRQKHYELDIDTLFVHSTSGNTWQYLSLIPPTKTKVYEYRWYANNLGSMAAMMQMDTTNKKPTSFQWYNGLPDGVNEISQAHNTIAYPNPATSQINFRYSAQNAQNIFVYDITGRQIGQTEIMNGMATLNTTSLSSGMYFYHVTDKSGNVLDNGKFSVL